MVIFLLKMVFIVITNLSYLLSRFLFSTTAYLLVLFINAFKLPGQNAQGLMHHAAEAIKGLLEYALGIAVDAGAAAISTSIELLKEGALGSASALGSAATGLVEQTRGSLEGLFKDLPELADGFKDMVTTIVMDLMSNYKEALAYLTENA